MSESPIKDVSDTAFWIAYHRALETERSDRLFSDPFCRAVGGRAGPADIGGNANIAHRGVDGGAADTDHR